MEFRCQVCDVVLPRKQKYCSNRCKLTWHRKNNPAYAQTRKRVDATWYAANREHDLARKAAYDKNTPGYETRKKLKRRARRAAAEGTYTLIEVAQLLAAQEDRCLYCGDSMEGVKNSNRNLDHVVPLSRGGSNHISNLIYACRACNSSKCDKLLAVWLQERGEGGRLLIHPLTGEVLHGHLEVH